jgi:hypothetical protein
VTTAATLRELLRLSAALAAALEAGDADGADRWLDERARLVDDLAGRPPCSAPERTQLRRVLGAIRDTERRSAAALTGNIAQVRAELAAVATGATALRAYAPAEALAPGFVDRRD